MKKLAAVILAVVLMLSVCQSAFAASSITLDGNLVEIPEDMGSVVMIGDRNFVPVRFVLEQFKYAVSWYEDDQTIIFAGPGNENNIFLMQIGNEKLIKQLNGEITTYTMDVTPFLNEEENRSYVPVRALAEAMGYIVDWDDATQTIIINSPAE